MYLYIHVNIHIHVYNIHVDIGLHIYNFDILTFSKVVFPYCGDELYSKADLLNESEVFLYSSFYFFLLFRPM